MDAATMPGSPRSVRDGNVSLLCWRCNNLKRDARAVVALEALALVQAALAQVLRAVLAVVVQIVGHDAAVDEEEDWDMSTKGNNRDDGADRHARRRPCIKRTWCVLEFDHDGVCVELPRAPIEPTDFGPGHKR